MKNTKFIFYWTSLEYGQFNKTVFQTILEGQPFEDGYDARDWFEENTQDIFDEFDFSLVFDHVVVLTEPTDLKPSPVEIIEVQEGKLIFDYLKIKDEETKLKGDLKLAYDNISFLQKNIQDLEGNLLDAQIEVLREETAKLNAQIEKYKVENEALEAAKTEEPKPKKEYPSVWIEPDGTVHRVAFAGHNEFAIEYLRNDPTFDRDEDIGFGGYHYEVLEGRGWARILGWTDPPSFSLPDRLGPKLTRAIKDYCQSQGVKYPDRINTY